MRTILKIKKSLFYKYLYALFPTKAYAEELTITITNIAEEKGKLYLSLYTEEDAQYWDQNTLDQTAPYATIAIKATREVNISFSAIPAGTYALRYYHDANNNGEMDTVLGIPTEKYGFSNNARGNFGPASFADAAFVISGSASQNLIVK